MDSLAQIECEGDVSALANKINVYFKDVSSHISPLPCKSKNEFHIVPDEYIIPIYKVEKQLRNINTSKSLGPDDIPSWILKDLSNILAGPICSIWNASFSDSYIPPIWKAANTCPLPKSPPPLNIKKGFKTYFFNPYPF